MNNPVRQSHNSDEPHAGEEFGVARRIVMISGNEMIFEDYRSDLHIGASHEWSKRQRKAKRKARGRTWRWVE